MSALRPKLSFLISHASLRGNPNYREVALSLSRHSDILIDSGAFTNHNMKIKRLKTGKIEGSFITMGEYLEACRDYDEWVWGYMTLDEIGNPEQTYINFNQLLDSGVRPIPIMQPSDNLDHLRFYIQSSYNHRLAVGGIAGLTSSNSRTFGFAYYNYLHNASGKLARIHALGVLKWPDILRTKGIKYADTTTPNVGSRFGQASYYDRRTGFIKIRILAQDEMLQTDKRNTLWAFLHQCGISSKELVDFNNHRGGFSIPVAATYFAYLQFHRHAKEYDLTYFFVMGSQHFMTGLMSVLACSEDDYFSYPDAKKVHQELSSLDKNPAKIAEQYVRILKDKTTWRTTTK